jgi:DNA polymerase-3 subunit chi
MRADFYQLSRDPAEDALALLAEKTLAAGERLLIVSAHEAQLARISEALWARKAGFLAHGMAGQDDQERQPILLSHMADPANGARFMAIADGQWRDAPAGVVRTLYLFDDGALKVARDCWRMLGAMEGLTRHFWRQEQGRWIEAG